MRMRLVAGIGMALIVMEAAGPAAWGQAKADAAVERARPAAICGTADSVHTYYLANSSQASEGNEIQTGMRNLLPPDTKVFYVPSEAAVMVCAPAEQQEIAAKVVHDLDRAKTGYRVSYTFTELENGKRVGTQHFSLIVSNGQRTMVKQGSRVPVATGSYNSTSQSGVQTQFQYIDVGMNFDATFTASAGGGLLKTKVEQSSVAEERSKVVGVEEPVVRQASFEGSPMVVFGRPVMLSSMDLPNSLRHLDVEVMVEPVK